MFNKAVYMKEYYRTHPEYREYLCNALTTKRNNLREQIFEVLGHVCVRCGFDDKRALQIDHINGGGYAARGGNKGYTYTYLKAILADPNIKENYQILCANHNWIKRVEQNEIKSRVVPSLQIKLDT